MGSVVLGSGSAAVAGPVPGSDGGSGTGAVGVSGGVAGTTAGVSGTVTGVGGGARAGSDEQAINNKISGFTGVSGGLGCAMMPKGGRGCAAPLPGTHRRVKGLRVRRRSSAALFTSLLLLLPVLSAAEVNLATDTLVSLRPVPAPVPVDPGPRVVRRDVVITPTDGGVHLRAVWQLDAEDPGWLGLVPIGPRAHVEHLSWRGRDVAGIPRDGGLHLTVQVSGPGELVLEAFVPGDPAQAPLQLVLHPAPVGQVQAHGLTVAGAVTVDDQAWTGARDLTLQPPAAARRTQGTLVVAHCGLGLTVREDAVVTRARLVWEVRQGALDRVSFTAPGAGRDLVVTGGGLLDWQRTGDRVTAVLQAPSEGRVVLEARWTAPVPTTTQAAVPVPSLTLDGAWRTDVSVQIARDGELEVLPDMPRWEPVPRSELPSWGQDLVEGTPSASYVAANPRGGSLGLLRFVPVSQPPVVVDVASHTAAISVEGRVLGRSLFQVRNERASHLRVALPDGARLVGVRVGSGIATPVSDGGDGVLVPLLRSVETVRGLISFPVEVIWFLETTPWEGEVQRVLPLPVLDAEVAVERTTLYLPQGFRDLGAVGEGSRVAAFSEGEGITYGFGTGDTNAVVADGLFQEAVGSWLDNDFAQAQDRLDELAELGADNEDISRLQSNLDLLFDQPAGASQASGDDADKSAERRIKSQARARSSGKMRAQKQVAEEAEKAERKGDYGRAETLYKEALELGAELEVLEEEESVEQSALNSTYSSNLSGLDAKKKSAASVEEDWWSLADDEEEPVFLSLDSGEDEGWFEVDSDGPFEIAGQVIGGEEGMSYGFGIGAMGSAGGGSSSISVEGRAYGGSLGGRGSGAGGGGVASPPPSPAQTATRVTASSLSVTIPAAGPAVHYQRLLLPAGATTTVVLAARPTRRPPRSR